jgi:hypothetical protein
MGMWKSTQLLKIIRRAKGEQLRDPCLFPSRISDAASISDSPPLPTIECIPTAFILSFEVFSSFSRLDCSPYPLI